MSAWIVDTDTIDYILTANGDNEIRLSGHPEIAKLIEEGILNYGGFTPTNDQLGKILLRENVRSVNHRYSEASPVPEYQFESVGKADPVVALKQIECLDYQSCERDDWPQSVAFEILKQIKNALIFKLPGFDDAPWGWTRERSAGKVVA